MLDYYERRAPEYEAIYAKPERQADLERLEADLCDLVRGQRVLELACGTGYWTRRMARAATSVEATDASESLAQSAADSCDAASDVSWSVMDAFAPESRGDVSCVVAGFFYSHILRSRLADFLTGVAASVAPGARLIFFDNRYVQGSSTPIALTDDDGDTYQLRRLTDGSEHQILKNFPSPDELRSALGAVGREITVREYPYYWLAHCETVGSSGTPTT